MRSFAYLDLHRVVEWPGPVLSGDGDVHDGRPVVLHDRPHPEVVAHHYLRGCTLPIMLGLLDVVKQWFRYGLSTGKAMDSDEAAPAGRFPMRFLTAAVILTGIVLAWLSWGTYRSYQISRAARHQNFRIEHLRGRDHRLAELFLECLHLVADGALRDAKLRRRTREALMPGRGLKGLQRVQRRQVLAHGGFPGGHEKNWGWPEKPCFAGPAPVTLLRCRYREIMGFGGGRCQRLSLTAFRFGR